MRILGSETETGAEGEAEAGLTAARARIAAQMPLAEKALLAGHVIDNSGCWLFARLQVMHLARLLALSDHRL